MDHNNNNNKDGCIINTSLEDIARMPGDNMQKYNLIKNQLDNHITELVLVEKKITQSRYVGGFVGTEGWTIPETYLGIITKQTSEKEYKIHDIIISTEIVVNPQVQFNDNILFAKEENISSYVRLIPGNIKLTIDDFTGEEHEKEEFGKKYHVRTTKFSVYIGNESVNKFFEKKYPEEYKRLFPKIMNLMINNQDIQNKNKETS